MPVDDPNTIDIVSTTSAGSVVLTISDHLDWSDTFAHLKILQDKINAYLRFVESGEILDAYPNSRDRQIAICVVLQYPPNESGLEFLAAADEIVHGAGIGFNFRVAN